MSGGSVRLPGSVVRMGEALAARPPARRTSPRRRRPPGEPSRPPWNNSRLVQEPGDECGSEEVAIPPVAVPPTLSVLGTPLSPSAQRAALLRSYRSPTARSGRRRRASRSSVAEHIADGAVLEGTPHLLAANASGHNNIDDFDLEALSLPPPPPPPPRTAVPARHGDLDGELPLPLQFAAPSAAHGGAVAEPVHGDAHGDDEGDSASGTGPRRVEVAAVVAAASSGSTNNLKQLLQRNLSVLGELEAKLLADQNE